VRREMNRLEHEYTRAPICPYCGKEQSDHTNGGDPGEWWKSKYIPDGDLIVECDECHKDFDLNVEWTASFTSERRLNEQT